MKKLINMSLAFLLALSNIGMMNIQANEKELDPIEMDEELYGTDVTEEEIIYDETLGINRLKEVYLKNNPMTRGPVYNEEQEAKYRKYFTRVSWINRSGVWSLSVNYRWSGGILYNKEDSYNILLMFHYNDSRWKDAKSVNPTTYDSVYHQYTCHYDFVGGLKNPYNLEPYVPDKGYWGFVADKCN